MKNTFNYYIYKAICLLIVMAVTVPSVAANKKNTPTDELPVELSDAALVNACVHYMRNRTPVPTLEAETSVGTKKAVAQKTSEKEAKEASDPDAALRKYCVKNPLKEACIPEA